MNDLDDIAIQSERGGAHKEVLPRLRDYLTEGHVPDGARIPERELCEAFGVSRTPMREALKVLASEGVVELLPNRGARMKVLGAAEIADLFDVMAGLEALAGRLACERISAPEFDQIETLHREMYAFFLRADRSDYFARNQAIHDAIFAAAGNEVLVASARSLQGRLRRVRYNANQEDDGERWREAVREHELILDALRRRDADAIASVLFGHLRATRAAVLRQLDVGE